MVLISGEPGIGKSRLTAALSEQIGTEPHIRGCAISAHRITRTARSIRSSRNSSAPPGFARDDAIAPSSANCGGCSSPRDRSAMTRIVR